MPCDVIRIHKSATTALRLLLAGAMLSISPLAALAANADSHIHASFVGVYVTRAPKTAPTMSVSLGADDGRQIKVTFNVVAGEQPEAPMVFEVVHSKLQAVSWNHESWGSAQPPAMTKGYKVKYLFWTTTMR